MKRSLALMIVLMIITLTPTALALNVSIQDYDPTPAEAGKFLDVWFRVENTNNQQARDIWLEITPLDGLELSPGEQPRQRIGNLGAYETQTVNYRLWVKENAVAGEHIISVEAETEGGVVLFDLPIVVEDKDFKEVDLNVGDIESDPVRIKPDDEDVKLIVTLQNLGDGIAKGTTATLKELPEGITFSESYSDHELLGNIEEDGTAEATYFIDVDENVAPGSYDATLHLEYKYKPDPDEDEYLFENTRLPVRINVKSVPLYEVTEVVLDPPVLTAGDKKVKIRVTVKNIGEEEGEAVRFKIYEKSEQPFTFEISSNFVAPRLQPGESGSATLEFDVDEDAALQEYLMDGEIRSLTEGDAITSERTIPISVTNPKRDNSLLLVVVAASILVIVFFVGRYLINKNGKGRKGARGDR
jgi:hypothetical protein